MLRNSFHSVTFLCRGVDCRGVEFFKLFATYTMHALVHYNNKMCNKDIDVLAIYSNCNKSRFYFSYLA